MDNLKNTIKKSIKNILLIIIPILIFLSGKTLAYNLFNLTTMVPGMGNSGSWAGEAPWSTISVNSERSVTYPNPIHYQAFENNEVQNVYINSYAVYCCDLYAHVRSGKFDTRRRFPVTAANGGQTPAGALAFYENALQYTLGDYIPGGHIYVFNANEVTLSNVGKYYVSKLKASFRPATVVFDPNGTGIVYDGEDDYEIAKEVAKSRAIDGMKAIFAELQGPAKAKTYPKGEETSDKKAANLNEGDALLGPIVTIMEKKQNDTYGGADNIGYTVDSTGTYSNDAKSYVITAIKGLYNGGNEYTLREIQLAWWRLVDGNVAEHMLGTPEHVGEGAGSAIKNEALAYEKYRDKYLDENNRLKSEYYGVNSEGAEAIIDQEEQSYTVGPFTLYYPSGDTIDGTSYSFNKFVYVKGLTVRTYDSLDPNAPVSHTLYYDELSNDFEVVYPTGSHGTTGGSGLTKVYPLSNNKFYVRFYSKGGNGFEACGTPVRAEVSFSLEYLTTSSCDYQILVSNADQYIYVGHVEPSRFFTSFEENNGKIGQEYNHRCPDADIMMDVTYQKILKYYTYKLGNSEFPGTNDGLNDLKELYHEQYNSYPTQDYIDDYLTVWHPYLDDAVSTQFDTGANFMQPYIEMSKVRYNLELQFQKLIRTDKGEREYVTILSSESVTFTMDLGGKVFEDLRRGKKSELDGYYALHEVGSDQAQDYPMQNAAQLFQDQA